MARRSASVLYTCGTFIPIREMDILQQHTVQEDKRTHKSDTAKQNRMQGLTYKRMETMVLGVYPLKRNESDCKRGAKCYTALPSGKQRWKKSGRGMPTKFLIESVKRAVITIAVASPAQQIKIRILFSKNFFRFDLNLIFKFYSTCINARRSFQLILKLLTTADWT